MASASAPRRTNSCSAEAPTRFRRNSSPRKNSWLRGLARTNANSAKHSSSPWGKSFRPGPQPWTQTRRTFACTPT
eukprot:15453962-Alexandrium_andersonii.AAC.1